jgi:hypothetical protein
MTDPTAVPTSINFAGALLYDDKGNFVAITSGSTFNVSQSYLPVVGQADNGKATPLAMCSGSMALKVVGTSARPVYGEYSVAIPLIAGTAGAQNLFSIENPAGSGINVVVRRLGVGGVATAVANVAFVYRLGRNNTFPSSGTVLTATQRKTSDPAPVAIVRSGPAGSVTNNMWVGSPGVIITAVGHVAANPPMLAVDALDDEGDVTLAPGEALIMVADGNDTDWRHFGFIRWQEST